MTPHIGIDARLNYYRVGGISTYTRSLIAALQPQNAALPRPARYTVLHSRKYVDPPFPAHDEHFHTAALWTPAHHRLERLALSLEVARLRLDLLHSPDFIPPLFGAGKRVITVHDLAFLLYPQFMTAESRAYYNDQIKAAVRAADHILTVSESTRRDLMRLLDVQSDKITVQVEGVSADFRPIADAAAHAAHLRLPPRYLLFVGTLEPRKNIPTLLTAYQRLRARLGDAAPPLLLVGRLGWLFDKALLADQAGVIWRDDIDYHDFPLLYNLADALVLPSHYEGFGLPVLEALACGIAPIISNRASLPEVAGPVGLQVDADDVDGLAAAMGHAATDAAWRAAMQPLALAQARLFTWERAAATAQAVYQRVLGV
jgi:glycosyltransferase involved in cell wall biosynthesis